MADTREDRPAVGWAGPMVDSREPLLELWMVDQKAGYSADLMGAHSAGLKELPRVALWVKQQAE